MGLLALLMILIAPIYQLKLISKKSKGKISISLFAITLLMIGLQMAITFISIIFYGWTCSFRSEVIRCDMTVPVIIVFGALIAFIVIPLIGIVKGLFNNSQSEVENISENL
jgi:hypothetical protein